MDDVVIKAKPGTVIYRGGQSAAFPADHPVPVPAAHAEHLLGAADPVVELHDLETEPHRGEA